MNGRLNCINILDYERLFYLTSNSILNKLYWKFNFESIEFGLYWVDKRDQLSLKLNVISSKLDCEIIDLGRLLMTLDLIYSFI